MISDFLLTWALVAVSLFNTILLLWLGLTLWLNAYRRDVGIAVTAIGFALGSAFFVGHAALLLSNTWQLTRSNTLWLVVAMTPVTLLPYVWYIVLLRYNGFWLDRSNTLRQRHMPWVALNTAILAFGLGSLALLGIPHIPVLRELTPFIWPIRELIKAEVRGVPLVAWGYALYVVGCMGLSAEALRRPGASPRALGSLARGRARPWLIVASLLMTVIGALVAAMVVWTITHTRQGAYYVLTRNALSVIGVADLSISTLIAGVALLLGQAISAYELFTDRALPRREVVQQWRRAIILAASYSWLMGGALARGFRPEYAVLLTALLMTVFFALQNYRAGRDWELTLQQVRPFVASQHWYDALVAPGRAIPAPADPFLSLCETTLNARVAYLIPTGPAAALITGQAYPAGAASPALGTLPQRAHQDTALALAVDAARYGGAIWAVPLGQAQGLAGLLLLGPRRDGRLYTQEEMEIARAAGERLIDMAAGVALSQRLMRLQRERMAATQVLDQSTRRILHDEVLPLIHTAMLSLASGAATDAAIQQLGAAHQEVSNLLRALPPTAAPQIARLGLLPALQQMVAAEFATAFDRVAWQVAPGFDAAAASLSPVAGETLYHATREAVRNAAKHGRPGAAAGLALEIAALGDQTTVRIIVTDNGPGPVAASAPASGQGLALHSTLLAVVGGSLALERAGQGGTQVTLTVGGTGE